MKLKDHTKEKEDDYYTFSPSGINHERKTLEPLKFSAFTNSSGITICESERGSFLHLRFYKDLENLKELLNKIEVVK